MCRVPACSCLTPTPVPKDSSRPARPAAALPPAREAASPAQHQDAFSAAWQLGLEGLNADEQAALWLAIQGMHLIYTGAARAAQLSTETHSALPDDLASVG